MSSSLNSFGVELVPARPQYCNPSFFELAIILTCYVCSTLLAQAIIFFLRPKGGPATFSAAFLTCSSVVAVGKTMRSRAGGPLKTSLTHASAKGPTRLAFSNSTAFLLGSYLRPRPSFFGPRCQHLRSSLFPDLFFPFVVGSGELLCLDVESCLD